MRRIALLVCILTFVTNLTFGAVFNTSQTYSEELTELFPRVSAPDQYVADSYGRDRYYGMTLVRAYERAREYFLNCYFLRPEHPDLFAEVIHVYMKPALAAFKAGDHDGARRTWSRSADRTAKYLNSYNHSINNRLTAWRKYNILLPLRDQYSMALFDEVRGFLDAGDSLFWSGQFSTASNQYRQGKRTIDKWFRRLPGDETRARLLSGYAARRLAEIEQLKRADEFYPDFMNRNRNYLREVDNLVASGRWQHAMSRAANLLENLDSVSMMSEELNFMEALSDRIETLMNQCRQNNAHALFGEEFDSIVSQHNEKKKNYLHELRRVRNNIRSELSRLQKYKGHFLYSIAHLEQIRDHALRRTRQEIAVFRDPVADALKDHLMVAFFPTDVKAGRIKLAEVEDRRVVSQSEFETAAKNYQTIYQDIMPLQRRLNVLKEARDNVEKFYKEADSNVLMQHDPNSWKTFTSARNSGKMAWEHYNFLDAEKGYLSSVDLIDKLSDILERNKPSSTIVSGKDGVVGYIVKPGDSMWNIARRGYGDPTLYIELVSWNPEIMTRGEPWALVVGESLKLHSKFRVRNKEYQLNLDKLLE